MLGKFGPDQFYDVVKFLIYINFWSILGYLIQVGSRLMTPYNKLGQIGISDVNNFIKI